MISWPVTRFHTLQVRSGEGGEERGERGVMEVWEECRGETGANRMELLYMVKREGGRKRKKTGKRKESIKDRKREGERKDRKKEKERKNDRNKNEGYAEKKKE